MDTFMCSSWYHYAYVTPYWKAGQKIGPDDTPWDPQEGEYWLPVDHYTGGIEHATMHLLYTRFFTKVLRDMGLVRFGEPMARLSNQGMILGEDGEKMSKSRGNVIAPDEWVSRYGADAVRGYLMFIGPWEEGGPWNPQGIEGVRRFLHRVWAVVAGEPSEASGDEASAQQVRELRRKTHQTIQKVTEDIERFSFNTMIAALMEFNNYLVKARQAEVCGSAAWEEAMDSLLLLMAPAMPHIAEELWQRRHPGPSVHLQSWPEWDAALAKEEVITLVVQVNGKVRDRIEVAAGIDEATAKEMALASQRVQKHIAGKTVRKVIFAAGKLVNVVAN
jgi:leucyl-tRNA synthetase